MMRWIWFLAWIPACRTPVTEVQCTEMLDRYVQMSIGGQDDILALPETARAPETALRTEAHHASDAYRKKLAQCMSEVSTRQYRCAMKAGNPDQWEACVD